MAGLSPVVSVTPNITSQWHPCVVSGVRQGLSPVVPVGAILRLVEKLPTSRRRRGFLNNEQDKYTRICAPKEDPTHHIGFVHQSRMDSFGRCWRYDRLQDAACRIFHALPGGYLKRMAPIPSPFLLSVTHLARLCCISMSTVGNDVCIIWAGPLQPRSRQEPEGAGPEGGHGTKRAAPSAASYISTIRHPSPDLGRLTVFPITPETTSKQATTGWARRTGGTRPLLTSLL